MHESGLLKELNGSDGQNNTCMKDFSVDGKTSVVWQTKTKRGEELRWHKASAAPVTHSFAQSLAMNWGSYVAALLVLKSQCSS